MEEKQEIKVGDEVKLKSGGPYMTYVDTAPGKTSRHIICAWFGKNDGGETLHSAELTIESVAKRISR
jgi:uncharacterized protein YodC (DUF2158 family)